MNPEIINGRQAIFIGGMFIAGSAMITGSGRMAGHDGWISLLLAVVLVVPIVLMLGRVASLFPGAGIFDAIRDIFGRVGGWVISLLATLYVFMLGMLALRYFSEFVQSVSLITTPQLVIASLLALLCAYSVKNGVEVLGRASYVLTLLAVGTVLFTVLIIVPRMKAESFLPVMATPPGRVGVAALGYFCYPLAECVALLALTGSIKPGQSRYRILLLSVLIGAGLILTALIRNIAALGGATLSEMHFPSYMAASTIEFGGFLQRIEVFISSNMLICVFMKIAVCVYASAKGISRLCGAPDYRRFVFPAALLMAALSPMLFKNAFEMDNWYIVNIWISLPFQVVLPVVVWIGAEIHRVRQRGREAAERG